MKFRHPIAEAVGISLVVTLWLTAYSWSEHPLAWGNFILDQSDIKKYLVYNPLKKKAQLAAKKPVPKPQAPPVIDSSAQKVLLIGDSMVQELEMAFAPICARNHYKFRSIAIQSSGIQSYARSDTLANMIAWYDPTLVIIVLGSNELTVPDADSRRPLVEKILETVGDRKVVWVGPPNWRKDAGINDMLEEVLESDRYFRSEKLTFKRKEDGIHPTTASSFSWADSISDWLERKSRYRIRFSQNKKDSLSKELLKDAYAPIYQARIKYQLRNRRRYVKGDSSVVPVSTVKPHVRTDSTGRSQ